jgi:amino acid transporter
VPSAEEAKNPKRDMPIAVVGSVILRYRPPHPYGENGRDKRVPATRHTGTCHALEVASISVCLSVCLYVSPSGSLQWRGLGLARCCTVGWPLC